MRVQLERLSASLLRGGARQSGVQDSVVVDAVARALVPGCLSLLEHDAAERNREAAVETLAEAASFLYEHGGADGPEAPLCTVVEPVLSCMARRMGVGADCTAEPSEEVRLGGLRLVEAEVVRRVDGSAVLASVGDELVGILERGMYDAFHEVKKAACSCAAAAAQSGMFLADAPAGMPAKAARLVKACIGGVLSHQHHRVRQAGIKALGNLVEKGGGGVHVKGSPSSLSVLSEDVVPALSVLVQDRQAVVRRALCKVVSAWLKAEDLIADEGRVAMLPVVVSCLTDETPDVVKDAKAEIEAIGTAWAAREDERNSNNNNGDSVVDIEMEDATTTTSTAGNYKSRDNNGSCAVDDSDALPLLPPPYDQHPPGEAAQRMVGAALKDLLPTVLRGLQEWTVQLRRLYARQLKALVLLAGKRCVPFLDSILPELAAAVGDDNAEVAELCITCAHIVASTCPARQWAELAVDCIAASSSKPVAQQTSALTLMAALLYKSRRDSVQRDEVDAIATCISSQDVRGVDNPDFRLQLLVVAQNLASTESDALFETSISRKLFLVLLQLSGQENDEIIRRDAKSVLDALAMGFRVAARAGRAQDANGDPMSSDNDNDDSDSDAIGALFVAHAPALLSETVASGADWVASSPQFQIFTQLLLGCPSHTVTELLPLALPTMYACASENRDAPLRIAVLKLIDALAETKGAGAVTAPLSRALMELAMLTATWRAGKTAAAVRYSAVVAMGTLVRRGLCGADVLRPMLEQSAAGGPTDAATDRAAQASSPPSLLPIVITCMDEDFYTDTRSASCHLCEQILCIASQDAFSDEQRRQLYPALLKRLDDSSDTVRIAACSVLAAFFSTLPAAYDDTNTGYLLKGMLLHMDDANADVQEAVCRAGLVAAKVKGPVVAAAAQEAKKKHRSTVYIDRVLEACR